MSIKAGSWMSDRYPPFAIEGALIFPRVMTPIPGRRELLRSA